MSQMNAARYFIILLLTLIFLSTPLGEAGAQDSTDQQIFPETGHSVKGEFLQFYKNARNPQLIYGYPISEQFTSRDGRVVQYFQRARFELSKDTSGVGSVQLTPIGQGTYESGSQRLDLYNPAACKFFQTGYSVCFAFLDFYEANGGQAQFGNPLSPFEYHENLIVQYFENARFEWRADRPEGQRVVLTDLGRMYFNQLGENQTQLMPIRMLDATISPILSIQARAFVENAIKQSSGQQTVYVVVHSQTRQPVENAIGKATIQFPDNSTEDYFYSTNASGLGSVTFDYEDLPAGELVQIEIIVTYKGLSTKTSTSFRIWY